MAAPLSLDHVFDFSKDDPTHDIEEFEAEPEEEPEEEPDEEFKEEPKEESKEEAEDGPEEVTRVSPITPPPLLESSLDSEFTAPITASKTHWMPPSGNTFEVRGPLTMSSLPQTLLGHEVKRLREDTNILFSGVRCLEQGVRTLKAEIDVARSRVDGLNDRIDAYDYHLGFIERDATRTNDKVLALKVKGRRLRRRLDSLEASHTLMAMDRERLEREFYSMRVWMAERMGWGAMEACLSDSIDVLAVYGTAQPPEPRGPPDGSQNKTDLENAGGVNAPEVLGCSYKTFLNCKTHSFNGTEGFVRLSRWFEKMESVFEISKFAVEDKVKFAACTLEGRALT
ncbi:hypothetical protein Tco_1499943 [Tanacetum coccineum]